jgi:hypothetical protein
VLDELDVVEMRERLAQQLQQRPSSSTLTTARARAQGPREHAEPGTDLPDLVVVGHARGLDDRSPTRGRRSGSAGRGPCRRRRPWRRGDARTTRGDVSRGADAGIERGVASGSGRQRSRATMRSATTSSMSRRGGSRSMPSTTANSLASMTIGVSSTSRSVAASPLVEVAARQHADQPRELVGASGGQDLLFGAVARRPLRRQRQVALDQRVEQLLDLVGSDGVPQADVAPRVSGTSTSMSPRTKTIFRYSWVSPRTSRVVRSCTTPAPCDGYTT